MTRSEIIEECAGLGVKDPRLDVYWGQWLNRAQKRIAQRKNWNLMHDVRPVTVLSGATSVLLGKEFKQLGEEESPVSFNYGQYRMPVKVTSRARIEGLGFWPLLNGPLCLPAPYGYIPIQVVFIEQDGPGGQWNLSVPSQYSISTNCVFNISAFWYPQDLLQGSDHNAMTDHGELCEAIINLTKSLAYFAEESDSVKGQAAMELYEASYQSALYSDVAQSMGGRTPRM